jgi:iron complex outermembrane receptor protein
LKDPATPRLGVDSCCDVRTRPLSAVQPSTRLREPLSIHLKIRVAALAAVFALLVCVSSLHAQSGTGNITGTVTDPSGRALKGAAIAVTTPSARQTAFSAADGRFTVSGLPPGTYTVEISASGFATQIRHDVVLAAGTGINLPVSLSIASVSEEVTVEANGDTSLASQLSPVKSVLDAGSARTEITSQYVSEFTSPVTDFADITQAAPGTVSYSTNGVGLGQAAIYFRGFVDDDYTMTWDGVPFNDSNDPSHHSWAYVPGPAIGYVDFDRSPGTASDMGPANFGGSIHMFSPELPSTRSMSAEESYGSFNTNQILGEFDSGLFGGANPKANFWFEGHHMSSDGYQTCNYQYRTAGTAKLTYKFSDKTNLSLISTVVIVDANTPNNDPYRFQLAQYGDNFYMQNNYYNADGTVNGLYYKFYDNHIPTNFEIVTVTRDWGKGWRLEAKPYTYSYSNHQHYNNSQYSDAGDDGGQLTAAPVSATSAIDKMNQYVKGGVIAHLSQASKYGVFRTGGWYEYTSTNRYQIDTDPTDWVDSDLIGKIKFHENFITRAEQPFGEYQLVAIPRLTITAGVKDAYYNMTVTQFASNKDVGSLGCPTTDTKQQCPNFVIHEKSYNNVLPSLEANYRIHPDWSIYGQYGRASIIPFSAVFDVTGAEVAVAPPPTVATTYQGGTVLKLNRVSMDADAFHIHFVNQYSSFTPSSGPDAGFSYYYATPPSDTNGLEGEANIAFGRGFSLFVNGTLGKATYEAADAQPATATAPASAASPSAWVALAPHDTETVGPTYQDKGWDVGFFNKRVGTRWEDDGGYHQTVPLDPFWVSNLFANYTLRSASRFDDSKIKLSFNNLFDNHNIADIGAANAVTANNVLYTPSSQDTLELLPGRSVMVTFQLGFSPKGR